MSFPSIPGYEITQVLGQGAMGTVYKARQLALDRPVAIKLLRSEHAQNARYLDRLQREAKLTARLDHPHVVKGIDYGLVEGRPYFVMEFAEGRSLKESLRERGRFSEKEAIEIAIQIAGALENAYRHGVVHRDVKPGNIMLSPEGTAKLTDLGLARRPGDPTVTHSGATMGTPQYISPEQARNPSAVDVRSDIYSLGATLYHLVTGSPPFAGESLADLLTKVLFEQAESASHRESSVSRGFSLVLRKMLAKDPGRRYQNPAELIDDLRRVKDREAPAVEERSLVEPSAGKKSSRLIGVAGFVLLVLVVVWWSFTPRSETVPVVAGNISTLDLASLQPNATLSSALLIERLEQFSRLDRSETLVEKEKATLANFALEARGLLVERARVAIREETENLATLSKEKRYLEAEAFLSRDHASAFLRHLGVSLEKLRDAAPEAFAAWDRWRQAESGAFAQKMKKLGESFALAAQRFASKLETKWLDRLSANQFRQAWGDLEAIPDFRDEEGHAAGQLPSSVSEQGRALLDRFLQQSRGKLESASRERRSKILEEVRTVATGLEARLAAGSFLSIAESFDRELAKIEDRWRFRAEDLLPEDEIEYLKVSSTLHLQLEGREEAMRREAATRVLVDFDAEFAPSLRQRDYEKVRQEWSELAQRPSLAPVRGEIESRMAELAALMRIRDLFGKAVQSSLGKDLEIREGAIRKSGRVAKGFDFRSGEFSLEPERGPAIASSFARVHSETVGKISGVLDPVSGQLRSDLKNEDVFAWALFQLFEGSLAQSRTLLERLSRQGHSLSAVSSALQRLDREEKLVREAQKEKERQAAELLDSGKRLGLVGEYARAREKYAQAIREYGDLDFIRERRSDLDAELARWQREEGEMLRAQALRSQFPGAHVQPLEDGRLLLRYGFRGAVSGAWKIPEGWSAGEAGLHRKERSRSALEFKSGSGPQIALPFSLVGGLRVSFRLAFPFESGEPFYEGFCVAGHSFGVWSGGESATAQVASWVGGPELYESHFRHPGWNAAAASAASSAISPRFRFLRGGRYEVLVELLPGGKDAVLRIDGQEIARSSTKVELPSAWRDKIEFRAWDLAELREVAIEGVQGVGK